ncbi:MAG TPA: DNA primase [Epsilonproteobacteria bacterium]|nr:DNA primase [Campylobacterota bacterium]
MIEKTSIESLKATIDIVDVVGNYVELKKTGANYKACCPFHGEKTASFVVSPSKQIYHCFGCQVGGDAIKFVMEIEKISYPEAIEKLASNYNFTLQYTQNMSDYSDIKTILERLQQWYSKNLTKDQEAQQYLHQRGISQASIELFGLGCVGQGSSVMAFLNGILAPLPKAQEAGVLATGESGLYARLTERITFPIYSASGAIVGFGGRTMGNHPAKYINSPQTKLFNKSRLLYGYHLAKESIYRNKKIIICEGYLDVIMLHQGGFKEAVATMGTALTKEHLPLLRKGDPQVILAYDGDDAGVNAALKAATLLSQSGFDGGVVLFPNGQDPADMITSGKGEVVAKLFRENQPLVSFVLEKIIAPYDLNHPQSKEAAFGEIKKYLSTLSEIIKESYIPVAATLLGITPSLFIKGVSTQKVREKFYETQDDLGKLSILKTLLEKPSLIDDVLDVIEPNMFERYMPHFEAIVANDIENPLIRALELDETIQSFSEEELWESLKHFLIKHYENKLKQINKSTTLSFGQKTLYIRKIKSDILPKLKKGELFSHECISTI